MSSNAIEVLFPNAVYRETDSEFAQRKKRAVSRSGAFIETTLFSKDGENFVIGMEAERNIQSVRQTGPAKYNKGYIDLLMLAALYEINPRGSNNVIVAAARALNASEYTDKMMSAMLGNHEIVDYAGNVVKYTVRAVVPWDEPVGGLARYQFLTENNKESQIKGGEKVLVVDIGGRLSSIVPAQMSRTGQIHIFWKEAAPMQIGIQNVIESLHTELKGGYTDLFQVHAIPTSILQSVLMTDRAMIRGKEMSFEGYADRACQELLSTVKRTYKDRGEGLDAQRIIVTGGGGGLMFNRLSDVFQHHFVRLADRPETINFANVRGSSDGLNYWRNENVSRLKANPMFICLDTGNTAVKARLA